MKIDQFQTSSMTDIFLAEFRRLHSLAMDAARCAHKDNMQATAEYLAARDKAIEAGAKFAECIAKDLEEHGA